MNLRQTKKCAKKACVMSSSQLRRVYSTRSKRLKLLKNNFGCWYCIDQMIEYWAWKRQTEGNLRSLFKSNLGEEMNDDT